MTIDVQLLGTLYHIQITQMTPEYHHRLDVSHVGYFTLFLCNCSCVTIFSPSFRQNILLVLTV